MRRRFTLVLLLLLVVGIGWSVASGSGAERRETQNPVRWELEHGKVPWAVQLSRKSLMQVPRAPVLERLAVVVTAPFLSVSIGPRALVSTLEGDRSETLRRVQTRRRVPRMNTDEPPWS